MLPTRRRHPRQSARPDFQELGIDESSASPKATGPKSVQLALGCSADACSYRCDPRRVAARTAAATRHDVRAHAAMIVCSSALPSLPSGVPPCLPRRSRCVRDLLDGQGSSRGDGRRRPSGRMTDRLLFCFFLAGSCRPSTAPPQVSPTDAGVDADVPAVRALTLRPVARGAGGWLETSRSGGRLFFGSGGAGFELREDGTLDPIAPRTAYLTTHGPVAFAGPNLTKWQRTWVLATPEGVLVTEPDVPRSYLYSGDRFVESNLRVKNLGALRIGGRWVEPHGKQLTTTAGNDYFKVPATFSADVLATDGARVYAIDQGSGDRGARAAVWKESGGEAEVLTLPDAGRDLRCSFALSFDHHVYARCMSGSRAFIGYRFDGNAVVPLPRSLPLEKVLSVGADGAFYTAKGISVERFSPDGTKKETYAIDLSDLQKMPLATYVPEEKVLVEGPIVPALRFREMSFEQLASVDLRSAQVQEVFARGPEDVWALLSVGGSNVLVHGGGPRTIALLPTELDVLAAATTESAPWRSGCAQAFVPLAVTDERALRAALRLDARGQSVAFSWALVAGTVRGEPVTGAILALRATKAKPEMVVPFQRAVAAARALSARDEATCTLPVLTSIIATSAPRPP